MKRKQHEPWKKCEEAGAVTNEQHGGEKIRKQEQNKLHLPQSANYVNRNKKIVPPVLKKHGKWRYAGVRIKSLQVVYSYTEIKHDDHRNAQSHKGQRTKIKRKIFHLLNLCRRTEKTKAIALEIAMLGTDGIRPGRDDYKLNAFPNKIFSGYQMLAWYYVSFKLALPDIVDQLGLNYEKEYEMADKLNTAN